MIAEYGCAENEGLDEEVCPNVAYADGDFCPEHGGMTAEAAEQRRAKYEKTRGEAR